MRRKEIDFNHPEQLLYMLVKRSLPFELPGVSVGGVRKFKHDVLVE
nr:hypothetical protein [Paenibacillus tyrfis]